MPEHSTPERRKGDTDELRERRLKQEHDYEAEVKRRACADAQREQIHDERARTITPRGSR